MVKYLKIYIWQIISIGFNFASVFVVTPYIASNQSLYGIYSIIITAYLFISYADFGFLGAGMKYASESYAQNNKNEEIEVIGFTGMVFFTFVILYSLIVLGMAINPKILVGGIKNAYEFTIARELLIILSIFCPVFVLQRIIQIIYGIRLLDYKFQRILIVSNLIKVISVYFFFNNGKYFIVEYFLFSQLLSLAAVIGGIYIAKKNLNYDVKLLLKSFKFSKKLFKKTKKLAFTSIFLTICWILYYELDPFVIGKTLGTYNVAIYAIGLSIIAYFRSLFGILFTPFVARFNYFVGLKDKEGLQIFFIKVMAIFLPFTTFPVIAVFFTTQNFIYSWVGSSYALSIPIAQMLVASYIFSFITYPSGILIMANEKVRALYFTSALQPVIFWIGIILTFKFFGLQSFAYFKFLAFFLEAVVYTVLILKFLDISAYKFLKKIVAPAAVPTFLVIVFLLLIRGHLPLTKNKINLLSYFLSIGGVVLTGIFCYYFTSPLFKEFFNGLIGGFIKKKEIEIE